jgi:sn-glycerol 3-phosphate transport system permease protein
VLWIFMFHPSLGTLARPLRGFGFDWNPLLNGNHAMTLVVMAAVWKQISTTSCSSLRACNRSPKRAGSQCDRRAGPLRRFWTIVFPLLSPTTFFLLVECRLCVLRHVRHHRRGDRRGPAGATTTMVYKVYADGRLGGDLGGLPPNRWC